MKSNLDINAVPNRQQDTGKLENQPTNGRFEQLDALRGVAALSVVFWHISLLFLDISHNSPYYIYSKAFSIVRASPLYLFMAGGEAVLIFFVLSGFVLALPFFSARDVDLRSFYVKRVIRVYSPYLVAVAVALLAFSLFSHGPTPDLSSWFNAHWRKPITIQTILAHVLLIGSFDNSQYGLVFWSLVYEMRMSIFFPLIVLAVKRLSWKACLVGGIALSILGTWLSVAYPSQSDAFMTLHYSFMFIVGALIARYYKVLTEFIKSRSSTMKASLLVGVFGLYIYSRVLWRIIGDSPASKTLEAWPITVGAAGIILFSLASNRMTSFLKIKPLLFLGRISYSLYLYHSVVIFSLVHIFGNVVPMIIIVTLSPVISIVVASLSFRLIEEPSMRLGRYLGAGKKGPVVDVPRAG